MENNKLTINTNLMRKEPSYHTVRCVVENAVAVSHEEFKRLKNEPLRDNELIAEHSKEDMWYDPKEKAYHCLLVYDKEQGDGLLVEAEGSSYVRYGQFLPMAKKLYEDFVQTQLDQVNKESAMINDIKSVEQLRKMYPKGTRICLDHMEDNCPVESGTKGTISEVDDAGNVHVLWDNGRTLAVIPEVDKYHVVENEEGSEEVSEEQNMSM